LIAVELLRVDLREFRFPDDYVEVIQFWNGIEKGIHVGPSDALEEIEKKIQRDPDLFLLAESNREIVGTVMGGFDGRRGLIYHLAVSASFRGQGVGARLMSEVESRLRTKGCLKCYLIVLRENSDAMKFYERQGWESMSERHLLYGKEFK
jgi:ribosomal protein S18 acetylase RimI-like enzyme